MLFFGLRKGLLEQTYSEVTQQTPWDADFQSCGDHAISAISSLSSLFLLRGLTLSAM